MLREYSQGVGARIAQRKLESSQNRCLPAEVKLFTVGELDSVKKKICPNGAV